MAKSIGYNENNNREKNSTIAQGSITNNKYM